MTDTDPSGLGYGAGVGFGAGASTVFSVPDYGTNLAAIQAAIDAATANGEGVVVLGSGVTYPLGITGSANMGMYGSKDYGFRANHDAVWIDGNGAKLELQSKPASTGYCAVMIGNGGTASGTVWAGPHSSWVRNTGIADLTIDASAISDADLDAIGADQAAALLLGYGKHWIIDGVTITNGWGYNGALTTTAIAKLGTLQNTTVNGARKTGMWIDGPRSCLVRNCAVSNAAQHGFFLSANGDYRAWTRWNRVTELAVTDCQTGILVFGQDNLIDQFTVNLGAGGLYGVYVLGTVDARGEYLGQDNTIRDGTLIQSASGGYATYVKGNDSSYNGQPALTRRNTITGLTIEGAWASAFQMGQSAQDNTFMSNAIAEAVTAISATDAGVTTATGNVIQEGRS